MVELLFGGDDRRLRARRSALDGVIADARERGWPIGFAMASTMRAWMNLRRGDLNAAESDTRAADGVRICTARPRSTPSSGHPRLGPWRAGPRPEGLRLIADRCPDPVPDAAVFQLSLLASRHLRIAAGGPRRGLADVLEVGERELRYGGPTPAAMAWRSSRSSGPRRRRRPSRATSFWPPRSWSSREAFGTPRTTGVALRGVALAGADDEAVETLESRSPALRGAGRNSSWRDRSSSTAPPFDAGGGPGEAREPLREAAGWPKLVARRAWPSERSRSSERRASANGQSQQIGIAALTPSELRAARMAAGGRSNREIADDLFVTPADDRGPSDQHLPQTRDPLRKQLAEALSGL